MNSQTENKLTTVAAFDFDGTISYRDTLVPFMIFTKGWLAFLWAVMRQLPALFLYLIGYMNRQTIKERFLTQLYRNTTETQLREWGLRYAREKLPSKIRPKALERIRWHQQQGHRCVIVSANLDIYLDFWAELMGFEKNLSTIVAFDHSGKATGRLVGANCWGREKKMRLENYLGPRAGYLLYAYGDSPGDYDLLKMADYPFYNV